MQVLVHRSPLTNGRSLVKNEGWSKPLERWEGALRLSLNASLAEAAERCGCWARESSGCRGLVIIGYVDLVRDPLGTMAAVVKKLQDFGVVGVRRAAAHTRQRRSTAHTQPPRHAQHTPPRPHTPLKPCPRACSPAQSQLHAPRRDEVERIIRPHEEAGAASLAVGDHLDCCPRDTLTPQQLLLATTLETAAVGELTAVRTRVRHGTSTPRPRQHLCTQPTDRR